MARSPRGSVACGVPRGAVMSCPRISVEAQRDGLIRRFGTAGFRQHRANASRIVGKVALDILPPLHPTRQSPTSNPRPQCHECAQCGLGGYPKAGPAPLGLQHSPLAVPFPLPPAAFLYLLFHRLINVFVTIPTTMTCSGSHPNTQPPTPDPLTPIPHPRLPRALHGSGPIPKRAVVSERGGGWTVFEA